MKDYVVSRLPLGAFISIAILVIDAVMNVIMNKQQSPLWFTALMFFVILAACALYDVITYTVKKDQ